MMTAKIPVYGYIALSVQK